MREGNALTKCEMSIKIEVKQTTTVQMKIHNNLKPKAASGMSKAASGGLVVGGEHRPIRGIGTHRELGVRSLVFSRSLENFFLATRFHVDTITSFKFHNWYFVKDQF